VVFLPNRLDKYICFVFNISLCKKRRGIFRFFTVACACEMTFIAKTCGMVELLSALLNAGIPLHKLLNIALGYQMIDLLLQGISLFDIMLFVPVKHAILIGV